MSFSYYILSYYFIIKKSKTISLSKINTTSFNNLKFLKSYISKVNNKLFNLGYPYGLNVPKYLIIKYTLSTITAIVLAYRGINIFTLLFYFLIIFYLPQIIIFIYSKKEKSKVIENISHIVQSMILGISSNMSTYESLVMSSTCITYKRLQIEFMDFIQRYKMYNYELSKATDILIHKFKYYELRLFLSTIIKADKEGDLEESLEAYSMVIEPTIDKNASTKIKKSSIYIIMGAIFLLCNTFAIIMYPIGIQILNNLSELLR